MMKSIQRFLLLSVLAVMTIIMAIAGLLAYSSSTHEIDEIFDARLAQYARLLASTGVYPRAPITVPVYAGTGYGHKYESRILFQIMDENRQLLEATENLRDKPLPNNLAEGFHAIEHEGRAYKVFALRHQGHLVITAELLAIREELVRDIALTAVLPLLAGTVLTLTLTGLILLKGLSPLTRIAEAIRQRRMEDLTPLVLDEMPSEISLLASSINALLERLQHSFTRERQFSADAAHELKTPLAALKLQVANLAPLTGNNENAAAIVRKASHTCQLMQELVDQLLLLSRLEPAYFSHQLKPVALVPLCQEVFADLAAQALQKSQQISLEASNDKLEIYGDEILLKTLFRNIVTNAIRHTPAAATIIMRISATAAQVVCDLDDSGPGIPASERQNVFDRFYRIGGDSSADSTGSGLGLAISAEIARLHHASIELLDKPADASGSAPGGLRVRIRFPRHHALQPTP